MSPARIAIAQVVLAVACGAVAYVLGHRRGRQLGEGRRRHRLHTRRVAQAFAVINRRLQESIAREFGGRHWS